MAYAKFCKCLSLTKRLRILLGDYVHEPRKPETITPAEAMTTVEARIEETGDWAIAKPASQE